MVHTYRCAYIIYQTFFIFKIINKKPYVISMMNYLALQAYAQK